MKLFRDVIGFVSNLEKLTNTQCVVKLFKEDNNVCNFIISAGGKEHSFHYCQEFGFGLSTKNYSKMFWEDNIPQQVINIVKSTPECKFAKCMATLKANQFLIYIKDDLLLNQEEVVIITNSLQAACLSTDDGKFYKISGANI